MIGYNNIFENSRIHIIAILAAMLLPALQSARARGQTTSCLNNLKGIGNAMMMYQSQYDDVFAPTMAYSPNTTWGDVLVVTQNLPTTLFACPAFANSQLSPASSNWNTINSKWSTKSQSCMYWSHYGQPWNYGTDSNTVKIGSVKNPSGKILHADGFCTVTSMTDYGCYYLYAGWLANNYVSVPDASRHLGKVNTSFADGHAETIAVPLSIPRKAYTDSMNANKYAPFDKADNFRPLK